jgi:diguanylate cyclase (GGDEF)-like protein
VSILSRGRAGGLVLYVAALVSVASPRAAQAAQRVPAPDAAREAGGVQGVAIAVAMAALGAAAAWPLLSRRRHQRQRRDGVEALSALSARVSDPSLEPGELLRFSLRTLIRNGLLDAGLIHVDDREGGGGELRLAASEGIPDALLLALDGREVNRRLQARVALGTEFVRPAGTVEEHALLAPIERHGLALAGCLPLHGRARTLGIMCAFSRRPRQVSPDQVRALIAGARLIALSLENAEMFRRVEQDHQELKELAITDALTGLYNRRFLEEYCRIQFALARRQGSRVAFLLADLDGLKPINDRCGHAVGDLVLARVGDAIRRVARGGDLPVRYGGDEFLVVMPGAHRNGALAAAERLRQLVASLSFRDLDPPEPIALTASVGVAFYPDHGLQIPPVLKACDAAMYQAKRDGRDRVVLAESQPVVAAPVAR